VQYSSPPPREPYPARLCLHPTALVEMQLPAELAAPVPDPTKPLEPLMTPVLTPGSAHPRLQLLGRHVPVPHLSDLPSSLRIGSCSLSTRRAATCQRSGPRHCADAMRSDVPLAYQSLFTRNVASATETDFHFLRDASEHTPVVSVCRLCVLQCCGKTCEGALTAPVPAPGRSGGTPRRPVVKGVGKEIRFRRVRVLLCVCRGEFACGFSAGHLWRRTARADRRCGDTGGRRECRGNCRRLCLLGGELRRSESSAWCGCANGHMWRRAAHTRRGCGDTGGRRECHGDCTRLCLLDGELRRSGSCAWCGCVIRHLWRIAARADRRCEGTGSRRECHDNCMLLCLLGGVLRRSEPRAWCSCIVGHM
jgi:hypothetical protein